MLIKQKQGDTLIWDCQYKDELGGLIDITDYTIECTARSKTDRNSILFSIDAVDKYNPTEGRYRLLISDTTGFNVGTYNVDIKYTIDTTILSTETFQLQVTQDVTE